MVKMSVAMAMPLCGLEDVAVVGAGAPRPGCTPTEGSFLSARPAPRLLFRETNRPARSMTALLLRGGVTSRADRLRPDPLQLWMGLRGSGRSRHGPRRFEGASARSDLVRRPCRQRGARSLGQRHQPAREAGPPGPASLGRRFPQIG
jgi:hypothetical protein